MLALGATALAADSERTQWNSRSVSSFELGRHYGINDVDGSRPDSWTFMEAMETTSAENLDVDGYR